jgi:DNA-binding XRE family transcriptional regulator
MSGISCVIHSLMHDLPTPLTNVLHAHRERLALTQGDIGELLGVAPSTIAGYESGRRAPRLSAAFGLELLFGLTLADLYPRPTQALAAVMLPRLAQLSVHVERDGRIRAHDASASIAAIGARLDRILGDA